MGQYEASLCPWELFLSFFLSFFSFLKTIQKNRNKMRINDSLTSDSLQYLPQVTVITKFGHQRIFIALVLVLFCIFYCFGLCVFVCILFHLLLFKTLRLVGGAHVIYILFV